MIHYLYTTGDLWLCRWYIAFACSQLAGHSVDPRRQQFYYKPMTLPNKLTLARIWATPLVFLAWYLSFHLGLSPRFGILVLWVLFLFSEITDALDGYFARRRNLVSDVGKLMDPFSDVFLRVTYFICFTSSGIMPVWALIIIVWRELGILFVRMLLIREGEALAASKGGKSKAMLYFLSGIGGLSVLTIQAWIPEWTESGTVEYVAFGLFSVSALAALLSFIDYWRHFVKSETHRKFMDE